MKTLWFKAKNYGWGWYPVTWQGWVVLGVFLFLLYIDSTRTFGVEFTIHTLLLSAVLIGICYKTGEKPEWRWGNTKKSK